MSVTEPVLLAKLATIQRKLAEDGSAKRCIGILGDGWLGPPELRVGNDRFRVVFCPSALAVREQMSAQSDAEPRLVVITNCAEQSLGVDVQARVFRNRFHAIDPWQTVRELFQAQAIGPGVPQEGWLRDELMASDPAQRPNLLAGTVLDLETVKLVVFRRLGLPRGASDLGALLDWAAEPQAQPYSQRDPGMQQQLRTWIQESLGSGGAAILDCVAAGHGAQVFPLGLVLRVLVEGDGMPTSIQRDATVRAERYVGDRRLPAVALAAWADAAEARFRQLPATATRERQAVLAAADRLLEALGASELAPRSDFLQEGLRVREAQFAEQLEQALASGTRDLVAMEIAAQHVGRHELAILERGRAIQAAVGMAVRLLRWLRTEPTPATGAFADAADAYAREGCFVDWAREQTTLGYPHAALQKALRALWSKVSERRERENRQFAAACVEWHKAPEPTDLLVPLERVLADVVQPLAESAPVLLIVLDGMSLSVFHELAAGMPRYGWIEVGSTPAGETERGVRRHGVAVLPTVTEVSRASLLSGAVRRGTQSHEVAAFESAQVMQARGGTPRLFHKSALSGDRLGLEPEVDDALRGRHRVVGVVLNAVDDWLGKGSEDAAPWEIERIKSLVALLDLASQTGRVVVMTSDHGHVRDHDTRYVPGSGGTRWRPASERALDGELLVRSPRVCLESGESSVLLPWSEGVRYTPTRQNGYHGGISPQEVLVPLAVFAHASREIPMAGWAEVPAGLPGWWDAEAERPSEQPARLPPKRDAKARTPELPFAGRKAVDIDALLASELFQAQRGLHSRGYPGDDKLRRVLEVLGERGDAMLLEALAARLLLAKFRVQGMVTSLRRVLNVDGAEGLAFEPQSETVRVQWDVLRTQFGLEEKAR